MVLVFSRRKWTEGAALKIVIMAMARDMTFCLLHPNIITSILKEKGVRPLLRKPNKMVYQIPTRYYCI